MYRFNDYVREYFRALCTRESNDLPRPPCVPVNYLNARGPAINAWLVYHGLSIPIFEDEDVMTLNFNWRKPEPNWGEGTYVFRDGDWVRP